MKLSLLSIFGIVFLILFSCHNNSTDSMPLIKTDQLRLQAFLDQKDFFRLRDQLNISRNLIDNKQRLYFQSYADNAFNRNEESIKNIDSFFSTYSLEVPDSIKASLYILESDCYFKLFQYAKALQSSRNALKLYRDTLDKEKIADIKNGQLKLEALQSTAPQWTSIPDSTVIHWKKDKLGLIEIPVKCHGRSYDCIFDTKANISSITQTYAARLGLKILPVSYDEGSGITGIKFKTGLGIADSLYLGNILIRNAVFQVMPDSILYIGPIHFSLNIIIGFPVIEQLREIDIFQNGKMVIPLNPSNGEMHNLALDGLDPVIFLRTDTDTLCFHLDLGADNTVLYSNYFERYKPTVRKLGHTKTAQFGGAGGIQTKQVYALPSFNLYLGNYKTTIDSVDVFTLPIFPSEKYYGNIGRDFTNKFNEFILNFKYMSVEGRP